MQCRLPASINLSLLLKLDGHALVDANSAPAEFVPNSWLLSCRTDLGRTRRFSVPVNTGPGRSLTGACADAGYHLQRLTSPSFGTASKRQSAAMSSTSMSDPPGAVPLPASVAQGPGWSQPKKRRQLSHNSAPSDGGGAVDMTLAQRAAARPHAGPGWVPPYLEYHNPHLTCSMSLVCLSAKPSGKPLPNY